LFDEGELLAGILAAELDALMVTDYSEAAAFVRVQNFGEREHGFG
jgi:hypothetical protein